MEKIKIILILLIIFLTSCSKHKSVSCNLYNDNYEVNININSIYDDIESIHISEIFILPYNISSNEEKVNDLIKQLDFKYQLFNNRLIKEYDVLLNEKYSLDMTLIDLKQRRFICE